MSEEQPPKPPPEPQSEQEQQAPEQPSAQPPPQQPAPQSAGADAALKMLVPLGRSGWAIAAGYLGLLSVLCVPAPLALITGILALRDIKNNPDKGGKGRAIFGIIMGSLFTLPLAFWIVGAILGAAVS